ncbi:unnamed protein product [Closterium sp. NIES-54]
MQTTITLRGVVVPVRPVPTTSSTTPAAITATSACSPTPTPTTGSTPEATATQRSSQGYTFSLGSGSVSWRSTRSSSVLNSSCEAEIYAGAMAAQELRWLTYLLADLGEPPSSPPVLYVDNKAMLALCWEHRLEHKTKHIALRYFLARELQQRGQLRLAYVASEANTADIFTKALPPGEHRVLVLSSPPVTRSKTRGQTRGLCSGRTGTTDACLDLLLIRREVPVVRPSTRSH